MAVTSFIPKSVLRGELLLVYHIMEEKVLHYYILHFRKLPILLHSQILQKFVQPLTTIMTDVLTKCL